MRKAQADTSLNSDVIYGYIPTSAKEFLKRGFEPPYYMPDICSPANLIYVESEKKIVAIDW